jgi:Flp pilus assembly protein TadB
MTERSPARSGPFGMRRKHYILVRVALAVGIIVLGVTLHHHGPIYVAIRVAYLALIIGALAWRVRRRRSIRTK